MSDSYSHYAELVTTEIQLALQSIKGDQVEKLCDEILAADAVFLIGVGRVFLSMQAFAKRLAHLGVSVWCVGQINEPAVTPQDLLIVGSGSGESKVPLTIANIAKKHKARVIHIGSNLNSAISKIADFHVRIPVKTKIKAPDEIKSEQIMTSLFEQSLFLLGDITAMMIAKRKKVDDIETLWRYHANLE